MKKMLALAIIGVFAAVGGSAFAADPPAPATTPAPNAQQQRMKDCNTKAADKKGDERKTFMSACLSGKDVPAKKLTQQEKMKVCNVKAEGKKGDERKAFMSDCLKAA